MAFEPILADPGSALNARLERLNAELRDVPAEHILDVAIHREWPGSIAYVSSFGAESAAMLALIARVAPGLPVLFIDTGMHFSQTLDYRDELVSRLGLRDVRSLQPAAEELVREDPKGDLWSRNADACCELRKVRPLAPALEGFSAWVTGRKRFHGGARINLPVVEFSGNHFKINPMANWTQAALDSFLSATGLPRHPMVAQGFPSIGCWPCTQPADDPANPRAGRWAGQEKSECGLHVSRNERPRVF